MLSSLLKLNIKYIQNNTEIISIQFDTFSQRGHTRTASTLTKKQNISNSPEHSITPPFGCQPCEGHTFQSSNIINWCVCLLTLLKRGDSIPSLLCLVSSAQHMAARFIHGIVCSTNPSHFHWYWQPSPADFNQLSVSNPAHFWELRTQSYVWIKGKTNNLLNL